MTKKFTVRNSDFGRKRIEKLRRQFDGTPLRVVLYGRGYRFGRGNYHKTDRIVDGETVHRFDNQFQSSLPLSKSERIAVYIGNRPKTRLVKKTVTETKWGKMEGLTETPL